MLRSSRASTMIDSGEEKGERALDETEGSIDGNAPPLSDSAETMDQLGRGEPQEIIERYLHIVREQVSFRMPASVIGGKGVEDLVHDTVMKFLLHAKRAVISDRNHLRAVLRRAAGHAVIDAMRAAGRRRDTGGEADAADTAAGPATQLEQGDYLKRLARCIEEALERLSPAGRQVVELRFLGDGSGKQKGRTFGEIGAIVGKNADAVRMQCGRALAKMASSIAGCV